MQRNVEDLRDRTFDLLVLGGGITGAGVALDASLRGFRVALIDKGDFASGTSSVSSKLVHGGVRYLEHGGFHLVYEALHERRLLLRNAPHLVRPLRFLIPFYRSARVPRWKWRTGLTLYDLLAGPSNLHRSRPLSLRRLREEFPDLQADGLEGGAEYYDAQMDDARLCLEVVQTAAGQGACPVNYVEAIAFERNGGQVRGVRALDHTTGEEFSIRAQRVLNATGPWVDHVCRLAGEAGGPHLSPTKGVHLVLPGRGLRAAFLLLHPADGRVFFVIPWMAKTLLGTTDTFFTGPPEDLCVTAEDTAYLLHGYNHYFRTPVTPDTVLGSFAGLRPLIASKPGMPSAISREFHVFHGSSGLYSVAGGKYTTYRHMAEVVTDTLFGRLGRRQAGRTRDFPLAGAPREPWEAFAPRKAAELAATLGLDPEVAGHLVDTYGTNADAVAAHLAAASQRQRVVPGEPVLRGEFAYQREQEMALSAADHLLRRTRLGLFHPQLLHEPGIVTA